MSLKAGIKMMPSRLYWIRGDGHWELAPAYDVTFTANTWKDTEADTHSLGVSSRRCYFTADYLMKFAEDFEIENPEKILLEICTAVSEFPSIAVDNGLPATWIEKISKALDEVFPDRVKLIVK